MYRFVDTKKKKIIELSNSFIVTSYRSMSSGATLSIPTKFVDWNEIKNVIGMRNTKTNNPLGVSITKPSNKSFFVGTAWEDLTDNGAHDEDIALFEEVKLDHFTLTKMKPTNIKKLFPAWDKYHHGDKTHLK